MKQITRCEIKIGYDLRCDKIYKNGRRQENCMHPPRMPLDMNSPSPSNEPFRASVIASSVASSGCSRHVSPLSLRNITTSRSLPRSDAKCGTSMITGLHQENTIIVINKVKWSPHESKWEGLSKNMNFHIQMGDSNNINANIKFLTCYLKKI